MTEIDMVRRTLVCLREDAEMSQSELAKRLPFTASRVSRLESGDIGLGKEDAVMIAGAIGSPKAKAFAEYLQQDWRILERPTFNHVSRETLWDAESALQRLKDLEDDPELKNAFLQQVKSCKAGLERSARFLSSTQHQVVFFGSPGVGKTTAICVLSGLKRHTEKELKRQMVLPTGSGRTTICETHVRNGGEYSIIVDPCSMEETRQYVADFCEHLIRSTQPDEGSAEGPGVSAEIERALRSMAQLTKKPAKGLDGKIKRQDPALELVERYRTKEDLQVQVLSRLDLARRTRKSVSMPRESTIDGLDWITRAFAEINDGQSPEFPLPRRIEVTVPAPIFGTDLDLRLIDTRGIDEPLAPRRDLQAYLDEERTIAVFCSSFKDAPDAAMLALLERAVEGGLRQSVMQRGILLVLPMEGEESDVRDNISGDAEEGREIRREQVATTLSNVKTGVRQIEFLNVRSDSDRENVRKALVTAVAKSREHQEQELRTLINTVSALIANKANEQAKAVFAAAIRPLNVWFTHNQSVPCEGRAADTALVEEMDGLRYASSLRASVNRYGNWYNFDYWHCLGFGARRNVVARSAKQITELKGLIETALNDSQLSEAHDFLRHFQTQVEAELVQFFQSVQTLGETVFLDQLKADHDYWNNASARWGLGRGYKSDIRQWTNEWFSKEDRRARYEFIEQEIQRSWRELARKLDEQLEFVPIETLRGAPV